MKKAFLLILVGLLSLVGHAQDEYIQHESQPVFPGGQDSLMSFLKANLKYPKECVKDSIEGRVLVSFVVKKDGSVKNVTVAKGVNHLLDEEACRVVSIMPAWKPGLVKGNPVNVKYTLPITFRLNSRPDFVSSLKFVFDVSRQNENGTQDPKGLYRLLLLSYKNNKSPNIPPYAQYKYIGSNSFANFAIYKNDSISYAVQTRMEGSYPLKYTGDVPQGKDGKDIRVYNSGPTGFIYSWYCKTQQNNNDLFPFHNYIDEWYSNEVGTDKMKTIISLCEMKLNPEKGNNLVGCWHKVGAITKVGSKEYLTKVDNDLYMIHSDGNMLRVNVKDANFLKSYMSLYKVEYTKHGFKYAGLEYTIKWDGKDAFKITTIEEDGTVSTGLWTRSGLPAKFQELFGTDSKGGIK